MTTADLDVDVVAEQPRASAIGRWSDRHSSADTRRSASGISRDAADVVLVEMGDHRRCHVGRVVAEARQAGGDGLVLADLESGEAAVDQADGPIGEVVGVGHRRSVLARVEKHDPVGVLDDIDVDRAAGQPTVVT